MQNPQQLLPSLPCALTGRVCREIIAEVLVDRYSAASACADRDTAGRWLLVHMVWLLHQGFGVSRSSCVATFPKHLQVTSLTSC
jgi:hypothetical protein